MKLTDRQRQALILITNAGGGALLKNGTVLCAGEVGKEFEGGPALHPITWLRLVAAGLVIGHGNRLMPTSLGYTVAGTFGRESHD